MNPKDHVLQAVGEKEIGNKKETKKDQPEKEKVQQERLGCWKLREEDTSLRNMESTVSSDVKF